MVKDTAQRMMTTAELIEGFLSEVTHYCTLANIKPSTFGRMAVSDSSFVERVREGRVQLGTIDKAKAFMEANPPPADAA